MKTFVLLAAVLLSSVSVAWAGDGHDCQCPMAKGQSGADAQVTGNGGNFGKGATQPAA